MYHFKPKVKEILWEICGKKTAFGPIIEITKQQAY